MFDIGGFEILILIIVSLVILKPEDIPKAMQTFGAFVRKINNIARSFYALVDDLACEAEDDEKEIKKIDIIEETNINE